MIGEPGTKYVEIVDRLGRRSGTHSRVGCLHVLVSLITFLECPQHSVVGVADRQHVLVLKHTYREAGTYVNLASP